MILSDILRLGIKVSAEIEDECWVELGDEDSAKLGDELSEEWDEEISINGVSTDDFSADGISVCDGIIGCEGVVGETELKNFVSSKMKEPFSMIGAEEDEWSIWEA